MMGWRVALLAIVLAIGAIFWASHQGRQADRLEADVEALRGVVQSLEAQRQIDRDHAKVDGRLEQGGADEALSDYGRDAASILWPEGER